MSDDDTADRQRDSDASDVPTVSLWTDERGRRFVGDGGQIVRLHQLIAYAEYGEDALDADHIHHALTTGAIDDEPIHVDAPRFLVPLDADEHRELHSGEEWVDVDGIPMLVPADDGAPQASTVDADDGGSIATGSPDHTGSAAD